MACKMDDSGLARFNHHRQHCGGGLTTVFIGLGLN